MVALLRRLAGPMCLSRQWLGVILPETHGRTSTLIPRDGARLLAGGGRPLTAYSRAQSRRQHTEAADPVEVDLKRLEGEDVGIVEVLMCRHKARNALGHVFVSQMRELVHTLSHDSAVRVVVFRSLVPGVFCAGADLKERALMNNTESDLFVHGLRSLMTQIASLPVPSIAAMDGVALGGGLELALACDLRTAAFSAQMGLIETTRGLLPGAGGSQRLPRMVGITLAKELIFTGKRVGGQTALEMGLVNRAVEQNQTGDAAYREALSLAREILPQVIPTRDRQEGMAAFIEKRPPRYIGE
uniref:enoyl-CoA hydratase domain-containing protein 2, mitochondrial isoform X2 n=1 Tax=Scatophagus argus TaxID=75038 RepID=UPI001ED84344|nr:enoyl-CoA hydratase domain-containing protein 2, mitochondrial isoform X2 [Scatophagus argus]